MELVQSAYNSPYWWYDIRGFFILTFSYRSNLPRQIAFFHRNISAAHLELAIGSGTLFSMISAWRRWKGLPIGQVTGVDYSEAMLSGARKRFARSANIRLIRQDVTQMDLEDESFDSVNIANAIHCFGDPEMALVQIFRVLRHGGTLQFNALLYPEKGPGFMRRFAGAINRWGCRKGILFSPFVKEELLALVESAGFEVTGAGEIGNELQVTARKPIENGHVHAG